MSDPPMIPLLDEESVRYALERLRQAEPLGDSPLRSLVWIRQQVDSQAPLASQAGVEVALWSALMGLIEHKLTHVRNVERLPTPTFGDREAAAAELRADFKQSNTELEAWSLLYYRYVRLDLDLQVQTLGHLIGVGPRQIHRRMTHGYRRLTEHLSRLESEARASHRRAWLSLKIPPATYATFFDQEEALDHLCQLFIDSAPPCVVAIVGMGGLGKTSLVHAAVQRVLQLERWNNLAWIALSERTPYSVLVAMLAENLDYSHLLAQSLVEMEVGLRLRLREEPALLVIDNADHLEEYEFILSRLGSLVGPGCVVLAARTRPPPDIPVHVLTIEPMAPDALLEMVREHARLRRGPPISVVEQAIGALYHATGGNPLAARLGVSQMAYLPVDRVLIRLAGLEASGDSLFSSLLTPSWEALSDDAKQVALALSLFPEGVLYPDLTAVVDLHADSLDAALSDLVASSLVDVVGDLPRYQMHRLTQQFVEGMARHSALTERYRRLLERASSLQIDTTDPGVPFTLPPHRTLQALRMLRRQIDIGEQPELLGEQVMQIAPGLRRSGQWAVWLDLLKEVASRLGADARHRTLLARLLIERGVALSWLGQGNGAKETFKQAIALSGEQGDFPNQAEALLELGRLKQLQGLTDPAYEAYQRAASVAARNKLPGLRRRALIRLAGLALHNGRPQKALNLLRQALETLAGDPADGELLTELGIASLHAGDAERAIDYHRQALVLFREEGDLPQQARALLQLGIASYAAGRPAEALDHLQQASAIMRPLGDVTGLARLSVNLGTLYSGENRPDEALRAWQDALSLQEQLGDIIGMAYTLYNLADLYWRSNSQGAAHQALKQALSLAERHNIDPLLGQIEAHPLASLDERTQES